MKALRPEYPGVLVQPGRSRRERTCGVAAGYAPPEAGCVCVTTRCGRFCCNTGVERLKHGGRLVAATRCVSVVPPAGIQGIWHQSEVKNLTSFPLFLQNESLECLNSGRHIGCEWRGAGRPGVKIRSVKSCGALWSCWVTRRTVSMFPASEGIRLTLIVMFSGCFPICCRCHISVEACGMEGFGGAFPCLLEANEASVDSVLYNDTA